MAELIITEEFRKELEARLASPEGQEAMNELTRLIARAAFKAMSPSLQASLDTKEGRAAFREAWPDIVDAYLFRRGSKAAAPTRTQKEATSVTKRRRQPTKK